MQFFMFEKPTKKENLNTRPRDKQKSLCKSTKRIQGGKIPHMYCHMDTKSMRYNTIQSFIWVMFCLENQYYVLHPTEKQDLQEDWEKYKPHNPDTKILDFQKRCIFYNLLLFRADDSVCWLSSKDFENICLCPMPLTVCCSFIKA